MCLRQRLMGQLNSAAAVNSAAAAGNNLPWTARLIGDHGQSEVELIRLEQLAVEADLIRCKPLKAPRWDAADLQRVAQAISQKVNYLLEPLGPVELDGESATLLMRSVSPSVEEPNRRTYYEIVVRPDELTLRRYEAQAGQVRQPRSMVLSVEVLARVVADLDSVFA